MRERTPMLDGTAQGRNGRVRPQQPSQTQAAPTIAICDWCEQQGHPLGRASVAECVCGLVRYDD
jgi:hypothetical protein